MKTTRENIQNRIEEINKELEKITKLDKKFPQGELQCFKNENRYKWKVKEENGIQLSSENRKKSGRNTGIEEIL